MKQLTRTYLSGSEAFKACCISSHLAWLGSPGSINADDVIKLFLEPEKEMLTQIVTPISKKRKLWLEEFRLAQSEWVKEL